MHAMTPRALFSCLLGSPAAALELVTVVPFGLCMPAPVRLQWLDQATSLTSYPAAASTVHDPFVPFVGVLHALFFTANFDLRLGARGGEYNAVVASLSETGTFMRANVEYIGAEVLLGLGCCWPLAPVYMTGFKLCLIVHCGHGVCR